MRTAVDSISTRLTSTTPPQPSQVRTGHSFLVRSFVRSFIRNFSTQPRDVAQLRRTSCVVDSAATASRVIVTTVMSSSWPNSCATAVICSAFGRLSTNLLRRLKPKSSPLRVRASRRPSTWLWSAGVALVHATCNGEGIRSAGTAQPPVRDLSTPSSLYPFQIRCWPAT